MKKKRRADAHALTRHHRKAKCLLGSDKPENISMVQRNHHEAFHLLFGFGDPTLIVKRINEIWIDPKYAVVLVEVIKPELLDAHIKNIVTVMSDPDYPPMKKHTDP